MSASGMMHAPASAAAEDCFHRPDGPGAGECSGDIWITPILAARR
ncbi:MAG: hypothetical protein ACTHMY_16985 [Solirubrobacteraceae bacterium]